MGDYIQKLYAEGDLLKQLQVHADQYLGPCGQSCTVQRANDIKRNTLLTAKAEIEQLKDDNEQLRAERDNARKVALRLNKQIKNDNEPYTWLR